jgi:TPR repeat protein
MKRQITALLAAASLAATGSVLGAGDMEEAMDFFESGHYLNARDHLRAAARQGDARAAEMLGFMYGFGSEVFPGIGRDPQAALYWFDVAARGGRPVGRYMVCALRQQAGAGTRQHCFDWVAETGRPAPR